MMENGSFFGDMFADGDGDEGFDISDDSVANGATMNPKNVDILLIIVILPRFLNFFPIFWIF